MVAAVEMSDEVDVLNVSNTACATECTLEKQVSTKSFPYDEVVRPKSVKMMALTSRATATLQEDIGLNLQLSMSVTDNDKDPVTPPQHKMSNDIPNNHTYSPCGVNQLDDSVQVLQSLDNNNESDKLAGRPSFYSNDHKEVDIDKSIEEPNKSKNNEEDQNKYNNRRELLLTRQEGSKNLIPGVLTKQDGSKDLSPLIDPPMIKGASILNVRQIAKYDVDVVKDPLATPSAKVRKSNIRSLAQQGDGDIWVEMIFRHKETGKTKIMFVSKNTGRKVGGEPPSGASKVIYLKESERIVYE